MLVGGPRERWTPSSDGILLLRETQRDMIHQGENRGRGWEFEAGEGERQRGRMRNGKREKRKKKCLVVRRDGVSNLMPKG